MNRIVAKLFRQRIDRKSLFIKKKKNETKLNRGTRPNLFIITKRLKRSMEKKKTTLERKGSRIKFLSGPSTRESR